MCEVLDAFLGGVWCYFVCMVGPWNSLFSPFRLGFVKVLRLQIWLYIAYQ